MLRDGLRLEENEPSPDTLPLCDGTIGDGIYLFQVLKILNQAGFI